MEPDLILAVDGRDKFGKLIQYGTRVLLAYQIGDADRIQSVHENMGNARKLFRLGKSLVEYNKLKIALQAEGDDWVIIADKAIQSFFRGVLMLYWIADNIMIL